MGKSKNKAEDAIKVTDWMRFKAGLMYRWELIKVFLLKFFNIRELVYVTFKYEMRKINKDGHPDMYRAPIVDTYIRLAWVSRTTPVEKVQTLFDLKSDGNHYKVIDAKIVSLKDVPKV